MLLSTLGACLLPCSLSLSLLLANGKFHSEVPFYQQKIPPHDVIFF